MTNEGSVEASLRTDGDDVELTGGADSDLSNIPHGARRVVLKGGVFTDLSGLLPLAHLERLTIVGSDLDALAPPEVLGRLRELTLVGVSPFTPEPLRELPPHCVIVLRAVPFSARDSVLPRILRGRAGLVSLSSVDDARAATAWHARHVCYDELDDLAVFIWPGRRADGPEWVAFPKSRALGMIARRDVPEAEFRAQLASIAVPAPGLLERLGLPAAQALRGAALADAIRAAAPGAESASVARFALRFPDLGVTPADAEELEAWRRTVEVPLEPATFGIARWLGRVEMGPLHVTLANQAWEFTPRGAWRGVDPRPATGASLFPIAREEQGERALVVDQQTGEVFRVEVGDHEPGRAWPESSLVPAGVHSSTLLDAIAAVRLADGTVLRARDPV